MDLGEKQRRAAAVQVRMRRPSARRRVLSQRRFARTILLGAVAVVLGLYWLADAYGVSKADLLRTLAMSIGLVALLALCAVGGGSLLAWTRRLRRRK